MNPTQLYLVAVFGPLFVGQCNSLNANYINPEGVDKLPPLLGELRPNNLFVGNRSLILST